MLDLLTRILCAIRNLALWIADQLVALLNLFLAGVAALVAAVIGLMPDFPAPPSIPRTSALGYANWFFPLADVAALLSVFAGIAVLWLVVWLPMKRWIG